MEGSGDGPAGGAARNIFGKPVEGMPIADVKACLVEAGVDVSGLDEAEATAKYVAAYTKHSAMECLPCDSSATEPAAEDARSTAVGQFGCEHYKRRCKLVVISLPKIQFPKPCALEARRGLS